MTAAPAQLLVLPEDILIDPVSSLPEPVRRMFDANEGDCALSRRHARESSRVVGAAGARFLELFREPRSIVNAVIDYSRNERLDPQATLDQIFPFLQELISAGFLVTAGSAHQHRTAASHEAGATFANYEIVRCVQLVEDTEVYQARDADGSQVALKVVRPGFEAMLGHRLAHEARVLALLGGQSVPRFVELAEFEGKAYLATAWSYGIQALSAAEELRTQGDRAGLLQLLRRIAAAYSQLHAIGVLHGDIHPRNILIDRSEATTLIDFGLAVAPWQATGAWAGAGPGFLTHPELARAWLDGRTPPGYDALAEQYAVAGMLYLLATGQEYVELGFQRDRMLEQIARAPVRPFADVGQVAWPELERVLGKALAKHAPDRFPDINALAEALDAIPDIAMSAPAGRTLAGQGEFIDDLVEELQPSSQTFGEGLPHTPRCSLNIGAAGVSYALYRLALARDRRDLLALSDLWIEKALAECSHPDAFVNAAMEVTPEKVGPISPFHAAPGLHFVRALTAQAFDDQAVVRAALAAFRDLSDQPWPVRDLALGRGGTVLSCTLLVETLQRQGYPEIVGLVALGADRLNAIWTEVADADDIRTDPLWPNLGVAHGWAGLIYSTLRWVKSVQAVGSEPLRLAARHRLEQLIAAGWQQGRGIVVPWRDEPGPTDRSMPGWCSGSAGLVHLGCLAHAVYQDDRYLDFAERCGWAAWEGEGLFVDLCCGLAGRAYALLELWRASGDAVWHRRAELLAQRAILAAPAQRGTEHPRHSLYKGELGLAVLLAELSIPEAASMPVFGREPLRI
jgi:serine/threonine-protein kinase